MPGAGARDTVLRRNEIGVVELAGDAERRAEVEMPDPDSVDPLDRGDLVDVLDSLKGLHQEKHSDPLVGGAHLGHRRTGRVAVVGNAERDTAVAQGRILRVGCDAGCVLHRAHHGRHDPLGTHVQGPGDVVVVAGRHAHDRRQRRRLHVTQELLHRVEAEAGMFHVEEDELGTTGLEDVADTGRGELDHERAELGSPRPRHLLQRGQRHSMLSRLDPLPSGWTG